MANDALMAMSEHIERVVRRLEEKFDDAASATLVPAGVSLSSDHTTFAPMEVQPLAVMIREGPSFVSVFEDFNKSIRTRIMSTFGIPAHLLTDRRVLIAGVADDRKGPIPPTASVKPASEGLSGQGIEAELINPKQWCEPRRIME